MIRAGYIGVVLLVVLALVLAPIAGVVGASATTTQTTTQHNSLDDDDVISVTDNVSVWDRSPLTVRADADAEGAVSVDFFADLNGPDGEPVNEFRQDLTVFQSGESVDVHFGALPDVSTADLANEDVQIVTAKLEEDGDSDDLDLGAFPRSGEELEDQLTQENLDNLNENATFSLEAATLDDEGKLTHTFEDDGAGMYAVGVATGDGLETDDGDLEVVGGTTLVGLEPLAVQDEPSEVSVDDDGLVPGDDVTAAVDATELDGDVDHALVLYDEETLTSVENDLVINVTEEIDGDFAADDVVIEHDIETINGVQTIEDDVSVMGTTLEARTVSGQSHLGEVIDVLVDEADEDVDGPQTVATDDVVLNASSVAVADADADTELDVETFGNWSDGEYRWIHVATGDESDEFQTNTGTITLGETNFPVEIDENASVTDIETGENASVVADVENTGTIAGETTVEFMIDDELEETTDLELAPGEAETLIFNATLEDEGDYDAEVTTVDDADNVTISVTEPDDPAPPPAPPAPPAPPEPEPPEPPEPVKGSFYDEFQTATLDEKTGLSMARFSNESPVRTVGLETEDDVEVLVQGFDIEEHAVEFPSIPGDERTLQRVALTGGYEETAGTITFVVHDKADLEALTAYRYDADAEEWKALETEIGDRTDDEILVEADTDRFSYFAISETGSPTADIEIRPDSTIEENETATLTAEGSDPGSGEITDYEWRLDGELIGEEEVIETSPDIGEYEVELTVINDAGENDTKTATLTVEEADDEDPDPPEDPPEDDERTVTVAVTDEAGEPIADATVTIDGDERTTDGDGQATFELEDGDYTVTVDADGYESLTDEFTAFGEDMEFSLEMTETAPDEEEPDEGWPTWLWALLVLGILLVLAGGAYLWYLIDKGHVDPQEEWESLRQRLDEKRQQIGDRLR